MDSQKGFSTQISFHLFTSRHETEPKISFLIPNMAFNGVALHFPKSHNLNKHLSSHFTTQVHVTSFPCAFIPLLHSSKSTKPRFRPITASSIETPKSSSLNALGNGADDLLIVGPGVLGRLVAEKWREEHPGSEITGQTVTKDHHTELSEIGINPCLSVTNKFPFVLFCAPPSRSPDYPGAVREAASHWNGEGSFLFTSSSAPYDCYDNGQCHEESPVVPIGRSPKTDILLKAEKVVLEAGGSVVRLAGLYKEDRGAHTYWLSKGTVKSRPDHILNLIHYEDAASLSVAILKKKLCGQIFLGCDNHPLSRQEVMDLVTRSGKFSKKFEAFTGTSGPLGKKLNNSKTRQELQWEPKYTSFAQFLGVPELN